MNTKEISIELQLNICERYEQGFSGGAIARYFKLSQTKVERVLTVRGIKKRTPQEGMALYRKRQQEIHGRLPWARNREVVPGQKIMDDKLS